MPPTASALLHSMSTPDIRFKRMAELPPHKLPPNELLSDELLPDEQ